MSGPEILKAAGIALAALAAACAALAARTYRSLDIRGVRAELAGCGRACEDAGPSAGPAKAGPRSLRLPSRALGPTTRSRPGRGCPRTGLPPAAGTPPGTAPAVGGDAPARFVVMHKEIVASCAEGLEGKDHGN